VVAWILTIDVAPDQVDAMSDHLWTLGTNGIAEVPNGREARLSAGFETEREAEIARVEYGGTIAPVDSNMWGTPEPSTIEVAGQTLIIDAGQSFGHGAHPTTQLCLAGLERHTIEGQTVLDIGCGSGVLSLAAAVLGASATAIDIDPVAIRAASENAESNGVTLDVSATPLDKITGPFDIIVVNMLVAEVEHLAADIRRLAGGLVILSGALVHQAERWTAMLPGWSVVDEQVSGEWVSRTYATAS